MREAWTEEAIDKELLNRADPIVPPLRVFKVSIKYEAYADHEVEAENEEAAVEEAMRRHVNTEQLDSIIATDDDTEVTEQ